MTSEDKEVGEQFAKDERVLHNMILDAQVAQVKTFEKLEKAIETLKHTSDAQGQEEAAMRWLRLRGRLWECLGEVEHVLRSLPAEVLKKAEKQVERDEVGQRAFTRHGGDDA